MRNRLMCLVVAAAVACTAAGVFADSGRAAGARSSGKARAGAKASPIFKKKLEQSVRAFDKQGMLYTGVTRGAPKRAAAQGVSLTGSACLASLCLASGCAASICLGSACIGSICFGSACGSSQCAGSGCALSLCGGSACTVSACGGSGCAGSICGGSLCLGSACAGSACTNCPKTSYYGYDEFYMIEPELWYYYYDE